VLLWPILASGVIRSFQALSLVFDFFDGVSVQYASEAIRGYPGNVIFLGAADHDSPGAKPSVTFWCSLRSLIHERVKIPSRQ